MIECKNCHQTKEEKQFLTTKRNNYFKICKDCINKHFDPDRPETFMWILEELDIPYFERFWRGRRYVKEKQDKPFTLGFYISYMKLPSFRRYGFGDSGMGNQYYYDALATTPTWGKQVKRNEL